jgi:hypothetical protein
MNFATRCALTLGYAWSAVALGASAADAAVDVSKVNGSIRIEDGQQAGDLYVAPGVTLPSVRGVPPNRHALP